MAGHTIVVAEGDQYLAAELARLLTRAGHTVAAIVTEPSDLPDSLQRHQPDLLLLDLDAPGGGDATRTAIPIVCLSASEDHPGAPGPLVRKPVHERELLAVIELALQRRAMLRQLEAHQSELATLIANVPGAVYRCELAPPWRFSHVSEHVLELTGRPAAEFLSGPLTWADLILPVDLPHVEQSVAAAVDSRRSFHIEYRILHRDGQPRWVQESGRAVYRPDGSPSHLDGVIVDITRRKLSEATLQREHAELEAVYEEAPSMLCVLSRDGQVLYANRAFKAFIGAAHVEPGCKNICQLLGCLAAQDDSAACLRPSSAGQCGLREALSDTLRTGAARRDVPCEGILVSPGGPRRVHLLASTALLPGPGESRLLLGIGDVTAREEARQALARSEEMYRALVENAGQAVVVAQSGMLRFANATAEAMFGLSRQELVTQPFAGLVHPDDRAMVLERHAAREAGGGVPSSYAFRILNRAGATLWVRLSVVSIDWYGRPASLAFLSDITARVQIEAGYGALLKNSLDGFALHEMIADSDGNPVDYRFLAANPAFDRITELESRSFLGRTVSEVLPGLEPCWRERYDHVTLTGEPLRFQAAASGLDKWFEVSLFRPREGQFAALVRDITESKRVQDALHFLSESGYGNDGETFFQALVRYLAESLRMDYVCVDRFGGQGATAENIAVYAGGRFQPNITHARAGTPCGEVVGRRILSFPSGVSAAFPHDIPLQEMGGESYVGATLWSAAGKPIGLIAVVGRKPLADISPIETVLQLVSVRASAELERELNEAALRESEERHRSIHNASPDAITTTDLSGRMLMVSPRALELFGAMQDDQWMGHSLLEFVAPEDTERASANLALLLQGGRTGPAEYRARRLDGTVFDVEAHGELIRGPGGAPASLLFIVRDISARKAVEAALRATEEQYRTLIHNLPAGVIVHGSDTRILLANPSAAALLDLSEEQLLGLTASDAVWNFIAEDGTRLPPSSYPVNRVLATRQPVDNLAIGMIQPGRDEPLWMLCNAYPVLGPTGAVVQVVVTFIDITERKRAVARLMHAQKMESVGRLAGGIAHDFNNLLTVINGYSQMVLDSAGPSEPMRPAVEAILKAGERAATLTGKILAFSRKQMLQLRVFDLNPAIEELRPMLVRLVGADVEIGVRLAAQPCLVNADPDQLEQVIMNLVVNARDAMPDGGELVIGTSLIESSAGLFLEHPELPAGRYVLLTVRDTGVGMDAATRQRIFEPFFTTKTVGKGTGLGLSMVQGIVGQSGGVVDVLSSPGSGSTFRIYLPLAETPRAAAASDAAPRAAAGGDETILLVDDQADVRHYAAQTLESYGYRVTQAECGADALATYVRTPGAFDLVLADVVMPGFSGHELADRLRALHPAVRVLLMSGFLGDASFSRAGAEDDLLLLQKPFSPDQLATRVRAVLDSR